MRSGRDGRRDTAQQEPLKSAAPFRTQENTIGLPPFRLIHQQLLRIAFHDNGRCNKILAAKFLNC
jgi:hypothetical protein